MTAFLPAKDAASWDTAAELLTAGKIVAFPTDTVYGLGARMSDRGAVEQLFALKNRPSDKAIILFVASVDQALEQISTLPALAEKVLPAFWPGALSAIFPKRTGIPEWITGGKNTVALRMPNSPQCLDLVRQVGEPLAVTSANRAAEPTPKTAQGISQALGQALPLIIEEDSGHQTFPSSLVDFTTAPPLLLREGTIAL